MDKIFKFVIAIADHPNANGDMYSKECLQKMANESEAFEFDGVNLYHVMEIKDPDPDAQKILDDNFWDLV